MWRESDWTKLWKNNQWLVLKTKYFWIRIVHLLTSHLFWQWIDRAFKTVQLSNVQKCVTPLLMVSLSAFLELNENWFLDLINHPCKLLDTKKVSNPSLLIFRMQIISPLCSDMLCLLIISTDPLGFAPTSA